MATKDYTDFLSTLYDKEERHDQDESSDEFWGCPQYKEYAEEWA